MHSTVRAHLECFTCFMTAVFVTVLTPVLSSTVRESLDDSQLVMCVSDCAGSGPRSSDHPAALPPQSRSVSVGWSH